MGHENEAGVGWLGSKRFWGLAAIVVALSFALLLRKSMVASRPDALVPVVSITGPSEAVAGGTTRYAVLVRNRFGGPIPNAPVRVGFWKTRMTELAHGTTNEGGETTIDVPFPANFEEHRTLVALADVGAAEGADSMGVSPETPGKASTFVSTDKPMYQPGQTIHLRALVMAGEKPIADKPSIIEVRTEDGIKVFHDEKPTSAFGIVAADFVLADQVKLGRYSISVFTTLDGTTKLDGSEKSVSGSRQVDVKRYSLPKLKVALEEVTALTAEGVSGRARATWIFGEPVVKGHVAVELVGWNGGTRTVTGVTDKNGLFPFALSWRQGLKPQERQRGSFPLVAKLTVEGGMTSEASSLVSTLGGGEIKLEAYPESGALVAGVTQDVFVVVTGSEQKEGIFVQTKGGPKVKVSARGIARISVRPELPVPGEPPPPNVTVHAHGDKGSEGHVDLAPFPDALVVRPEHDAFDAGSPARVTVLGGDPGDRVSLRLTKGSEPTALGSCVVADFATGCDVTLALPVNVSGLAWIHAMTLPGARGGQVKTGKRMVVVGGGLRDLALKVTPDRASYAPGAKGSIDIAVTSASGAPVKAQLGVAVADEAVFALAEVRPDLEKIFFTIDRDLAQMRRPYSYSYNYGQSSSGSGNATLTERPLPPGFDVSATYDKATAADVRAVTLAILTTMPDVGASEIRTSLAVANRADVAVDEQKKRLVAWAAVLLTLYTLLAFVGFAVYGWSRFRRPVPAAVAPEEATAFRVETRALYIDWLIAALGPPGLAFFGVAAGSGFGSSVQREPLLGVWLVLAIFCTVLLVRAVLRVSKTAVGLQSQPLRRALVFLPVAAFLAHLTLVLILADRGERLEYLLGIRSDALFLPIAFAFAAQLACGALSVVRQTLLRDVSRKSRLWLFFSRASFLGLPVTLLLAGVLVQEHVHRTRVGWDEYESVQVERQLFARSGESSDNKEGGTGTRAKGEESAPGSRSGRFAAAGGKQDPSRMRDYFPETLLWAPDVVTDDAGHATVSVPFADSITTWRFGLRAVSKAGQLGSTTVPLVVAQDFFVDASVPPLLTQGDEMAIPVTVYSYLPEAQEVSLAIEGAGLGAVGAASTVLHLEPRETRGFRFVVRADQAGDRVLRIKATGRSRADALERRVKVVPNGLAVVRTTNATFTGAGKTGIELPGAAIDGGNDLFVKIYGGPLSQVSEGLDGVFTMPHGCFEQTSSVTYPSILALEFLQRSKAVSPDVERKARQYIGEGYQRLVSFEVPGGGFSLFGKAPASTTLTAYGLLELSDMARVASVDEQVLERTREWLYGRRTKSGGWAKPPGYYEKAPNQPQPDDVLVTAYVAWSLATAEGPNRKDARLASVLDVVAKASGPLADEPYALAIRANALLAGQRPADARPLLDRLAATMIRDEEGVHWTSKATGVMYSYGASMDVEVTGLASHALARAALQPEARAGAISWLAARRSAHGTWSTTQATIAAMRALLDEAKPAPKEPQDLTVLVDGQIAETFRLEVAARDVHHLIGLRKWATTGKHDVEVRASGAADVAYQLVAQHYLPWQKRAPGQPSPLVLDVAFAPNAVPSGSVTSCHVRVAWRGKEAARMPLVEIGIPPAFEVDTTDLEKLVASPDSRVQRFTVERSKVTLYLVDLPEDKPLSIDLPLRALRPARVVVPASTAYLYYEPEVRAETVPVVVRSL